MRRALPRGHGLPQRYLSVRRLGAAGPTKHRSVTFPASDVAPGGSADGLRQTHGRLLRAGVGRGLVQDDGAARPTLQGGGTQRTHVPMPDVLSRREIGRCLADGALHALDYGHLRRPE